jgi:citrate lyase subunit beta/citryl-CoA lyase
MTTDRDLPMWRSMLFVPVIVDKFVDAAHRRGADAIILDLEDSVPESEKPRARTLIQAAAAKVSRGGADVTVRLNRPWRQCLQDLEAAVSPAVRALLLPKIMSADHIKLIVEVIDELEVERGMPRGATKLIPMVETAEAFFKIHEIARADPRIVALNLGAEDFALSVGMLPEAEGLFYPKQQTIIAARAAGVMPLGFIGTVADFRDLEAFRATIKRSRRMGFMGASVIHPGQIQILNEEFRPTAEEVALARKIVAAYEKSTAEGIGAIVVDGKMIDVPIVVRAQQTLAREAAIEKAEAKKQKPEG